MSRVAVGIQHRASWSLRGAITKLLEISPRQAEFELRGFTAPDADRRNMFETIGRTFVAGYNSALHAETPDEISRFLATVPPARRGFAAEGAAMGTAVIDALPFRQPRFGPFLRAFENDFTYLIHVGAGWALARLPWRRGAILTPLDPVHRWLAFDGLGFHDAYFGHRRVLAGWRRMRRGYRARCYDQGVGRALWFIRGGSVARAASHILALPPERHGDLWSGLGLAMSYAGGADRADFLQAFDHAKRHSPAFAQGVAFACEAHARAGDVPGQTEMAARVMGFSATELVALVRDSRKRLTLSSGEPAYEIWRRAVARSLAPELEARP